VRVAAEIFLRYHCTAMVQVSSPCLNLFSMGLHGSSEDNGSAAAVFSIPYITCCLLTYFQLCAPCSLSKSDDLRQPLINLHYYLTSLTFRTRNTHDSLHSLPVNLSIPSFGFLTSPNSENTVRMMACAQF